MIQMCLPVYENICGVECSPRFRGRSWFRTSVWWSMGSVRFLTCFQIFGTFVSLVFLGQAFTIMLVYIWSRRNPNVRMNFFGLLNFQAPFLPWVLMGFSLLLGNSIIVDLLGARLMSSLSSGDEMSVERKEDAVSLLYSVTGIRLIVSMQSHWLDCLFPSRYCRWSCVFLPGGCFPQPARWRKVAKNSIHHVSSSQCFCGSNRTGPSLSPSVPSRSVDLLFDFLFELCVSCRKMLFDTPEEDANYNPLPEERPGGFAWGEGQRLGG